MCYNLRVVSKKTLLDVRCRRAYTAFVAYKRLNTRKTKQKFVAKTFESASS